MAPTVRRLGVLAASAAFLLLLHMLLLAGAAPVVRRATVHLPGWPAGSPPIRLAFLSDLHVSTPGDTPDTLRATLARVVALKPDAVLIGGDLLDNRTFGVRTYRPGETVAPLVPIARAIPVVAVLGNHDIADEAELRAALATAHVTLLVNAARRHGPLALVGVGDAFSRRDDVPRAVESWRRVGGVAIVLTHSPDIAPALPPAMRLLLAGHTHCGQLRLPLLGAPETHSRFGQRYGCGLVRERGRAVIVSAGLGISSLPIRLGAAPDLWLVTVGP